MTFSRLHITVFLALAAAVWAAFLLVRDIPVTWEHVAPFGTVVGFLVLVGVAFERMLWRLPWLHGWFVKRPDLRGTWRVGLQSDWIDPETEESIPLIVCYMGVAQTLSTLKMHLMTPESESFFIADEIRPSPNATGYRIVGVYTNKPQVHLRGDRSEIHNGALVLDAHGRPSRPETLTGEFWTDRKTTGRMTFTGCVPEVFTRFEDADRHFRGR